jgi:hydrophobe/amphiphile efflux-3 (HAE3) family protein
MWEWDALKIFEFFASQSEKRPWLVVIVAGLITLFLAAGIPRISTELSQEAMMPKHYKSVQALDEFNDAFGGFSSENVLLTAEDVTDPEIARALFALSPEMMVEAGFAEGQVLGVETYLDFLKYQFPEMLKSMGLDMPVDISTLDDTVLVQVLNFYLDPDPDSPFLDTFANSAGVDLSEEAKAQFMTILISNSVRIKEGLIKGDENGTYNATLINFQLNPNLSENELTLLGGKFKDFVGAEFRDIEGVETYLAGDASMQKESMDFMQKETSKLMLIALAFIMLILYLTFRRFSDVGLPLLIIFVAIFWLLGFMGWVGITYTTMSVAIMPLMLGINIAYVIHILSRYYEEREDGLSVDLSATTSIKTVGVAVFLTAITTVIGFSSFMITDIPPMRDFGLLCMLGIVFSFLLSLTLLPAIVVLRDRRKKAEKLESHLEKMRARRRDAWYGQFTDRSLVRMATVSERHHWTVAIITLALLAFAVFAMFNVRKMFPEGMPSREASNKITEIFGPQQFDIILVEGDVYDPANLEALLALEDSIVLDSRNQPGNTDYFNREAIRSIADIIENQGGGTLPDSREAVQEKIDGFKNVPQASMFIPIEREGSSPMTVVMLSSGFPDTEDELKVKTDIMRDKSVEIMEETDLELSSTGFTVLIADLLGNILPTQLKTSGLALLLCALILIIVFKSFVYGIATLIVVVCGMVAELVFLFAMRWPLDLMTVMVAALVIGAGIDFGIHITHRFREEFHANGTTLEEALKNTVKHVGRALLAAALTTCGVFAIIGFSSMGMMQRFGWATTVGLLGALFGAILVLPSVLAIVAKRRGGLTEESPAVPAEE